ALSASGLPANRLKRWWRVTEFPYNATITFHYNDSDIVGNEAAYRVYRITSSGAAELPTVIDTVNNTATVTAVNTGNYSDWTFADSSGPPTVSTNSPVWIGLTQAELS